MPVTAHRLVHESRQQHPTVGRILMDFARTQLGTEAATNCSKRSKSKEKEAGRPVGADIANRSIAVIKIESG